MSKTEDRLEQARAAGSGPRAHAAVTEAATTADGRDAAATLPLAAYVPMGAVSRYERPKAAIKSDKTKSWISRAAPVVMSHKKQWFAALIDGLVARGLVDRRQEEDDRRKVALRLTKEGERILGEADRAVDEYIASLAGYLPSKEEAMALRSLELWGRAMVASREAPQESTDDPEKAVK